MNLPILNQIDISEYCGMTYKQWLEFDSVLDIWLKSRGLDTQSIRDQIHADFLMKKARKAAK